MDRVAQAAGTCEPPRRGHANFGVDAVNALVHAEQFAKEIAAEEKTIIPGDEIDIDFTSSTISWRGEKFTFPALGSVPQSLVIAGGVEILVAKRLGVA